MTITHATRGKRRLVFPRSTPADQQWIYQLACPFQLSPTEVALSLNIRMGKTRVVDIEIGGDFVIFDDFENIDDSRCVTGPRGEVIDHPRTGEKIRMVPTPGMPGFIPLGAKREDGSDHPHAGTGFATVFSHGYPAALGDTDDTHIDVDADIYGEFTLMQLEYDGKELHITDQVTVEDNQVIDGTQALFMGLAAAIPSGDDLLSAFDTGSFADWDSGVARWSRGSDGKWALAEHQMITEHACESSLVRDVDGSLLFYSRPWGATNKESNFLILHRSTDEGKTWERICRVDMRWQMCPMTINTALDGTPYIMQNRFREPRVNRLASREMIWAWPLSEDRQNVDEPIIIRDATTGLGPPPNGTTWRIDHPMGVNVRLRDGKWRHILCYRALEDAEMRTDAGATPMTGTYVEELFSDGDPRHAWRF